jgi:hypothetical protein
LFTSEVHSTQLGNRIVAVLEEDLLVELFGAFEADGRIDRMIAADVEISHELVEEEAAQALGAAAVPSEQRTLDDFGKVDERKDRTIEVGEVAPQRVGLGGRVLLGHVDRHSLKSYGVGFVGRRIARPPDLRLEHLDRSRATVEGCGRGIT